MQYQISYLFDKCLAKVSDGSEYSPLYSVTDFHGGIRDGAKVLIWSMLLFSTQKYAYDKNLSFLSHG